MVSVTHFGDNPFQPGVTEYDYTPDQLIAGQNPPPTTHNILLMSGTLVRGAVIGRQTDYSIASVTGTNTGNGTIGSLKPGSAGPQFGGSYVLTATGATTFTVVDPEGNALGNATVGTPYVSTELTFTITAGGTPFAAADSFTVTAQRASGNFINCVKTASDGSQTPVAILVDNCDASVTPQICGAYFMGEFNASAVTYDPSWLLADIAVSLQARGIHLKSVVIAADPS